MIPVNAAYLPLTDNAPLVIALEHGLAEEEGIDLRLTRLAAWPSVNEMLVNGRLDAAPMLAPLAVATSIGINGRGARLSAPFKLNVNGNALVMTTEFAVRMGSDPARRIADPIGAARDFAHALRAMDRRPVIGVVHRYSTHALILRYFLGQAGVDPDREVTLEVLPPSLMVEAMRMGEIDGFIAGEPWGSVAIVEGLAELILPGVSIWRRGVEKLLAMRTEWMEANPDTVDRLLRALSRAAAWCDDPAHHMELAHLLEQPRYVGQPAEFLITALSGTLYARLDDVPIHVPDFLLFHRDNANFPWKSQALWIYSQFLRWRMTAPTPEREENARAVFRPDVYRRALVPLGLPTGGVSGILEDGGHTDPATADSIAFSPDCFFDGRGFDPGDIPGYIAGFPPLALSGTEEA